MVGSHWTHKSAEVVFQCQTRFSLISSIREVARFSSKIPKPHVYTRIHISPPLPTHPTKNEYVIAFDTCVFSLKNLELNRNFCKFICFRNCWRQRYKCAGHFVSFSLCASYIQILDPIWINEKQNKHEELARLTVEVALANRRDWRRTEFVQLILSDIAFAQQLFDLIKEDNKNWWCPLAVACR